MKIIIKHKAKVLVTELCYALTNKQTNRRIRTHSVNNFFFMGEYYYLTT